MAGALLRNDDEPVEVPEIGERPVESSVVCVLTRFGFKHPWQLAATWHDYRAVARSASQVEIGLLKQAFLVESLTSCFSFSLWRDAASIPLFGTAVPEHVTAARRVFGRVRFEPDAGPEIWSTRWQLMSVSNNLRWPDLDLASQVVGAP